MVKGPLPRPVAERALEKVSVEDSGCWTWRGYRDRDGYARISERGRPLLAYGVLYREFIGPVPADLGLDHVCRNPGCVNPAHLEPVTHAENIRRGDHSKNKARAEARVTCPQGHPLSGENLYLHGGARRCKTCRREVNRRRRAA